MSTIREMAEAVAASLDKDADFFLVLRPKDPDPRTGRKTSTVATNVGKAGMRDMAVEGTSTYIMDQLTKERAAKGE
jgi:hypothetical protein